MLVTNSETITVKYYVIVPPSYLKVKQILTFSPSDVKILESYSSDGKPSTYVFQMDKVVVSDLMYEDTCTDFIVCLKADDEACKTILSSIII